MKYINGTPQSVCDAIKTSHKSKNVDAVDIINIIYAMTDYSNQSPIGKDRIDLKIKAY